MVIPKVDLTGFKVNNWTVVKQIDDYVSPMGKHYANWLCRCVCGEEEVFQGNRIQRNMPMGCKSCRLSEKRKFDLSGEYGIGYTSNTNKPFMFDKEDYDLIKGYTWHEKVGQTGTYIMASAWDASKKKGKTVLLHNLIMGCKGIDHINRDTFDNRKANLRICSNMENSWNRGVRKNNKSGVTGVWLNKQSNLWTSYIMYDGDFKNLGVFNNKEDAVRARLVAENELFGEYAPQKDLFNEYNII